MGTPHTPPGAEPLDPVERHLHIGLTENVAYVLDRTQALCESSQILIAQFLQHIPGCISSSLLLV